jgi:hypothetical protein
MLVLSKIDALGAFSLGKSEGARHMSWIGLSLWKISEECQNRWENI